MTRMMMMMTIDSGGEGGLSTLCGAEEKPCSGNITVRWEGLHLKHYYSNEHTMDKNKGGGVRHIMIDGISKFNSPNNEVREWGSSWFKQLQIYLHGGTGKFAIQNLITHPEDSIYLIYTALLSSSPSSRYRHHHDIGGPCKLVIDDDAGCSFCTAQGQLLSTLWESPILVNFFLWVAYIGKLFFIGRLYW